MRKIAFIMFIVLALTLLTACREKVDINPSKRPSVTDVPGISPSVSPSAQDPASTQSPTPSAPDASPSQEPKPAIDYSKDPMGYLRAYFPRIDGSTSLIPLETGIRAAIFGIPQEEAAQQILHTTTYVGFSNLLEEACDLLLTVPLSDDQYKSAENQGVALEEVPISKEGFVFVVNYNNPVDTLTQEQIRKIYSGQITNWKEVGGRDEKIIAYQRDRTSGSQNYMIKFMGDTPLIDAPKELRPGSMSGLMDVIAINDNASCAIGYSVYAYAADMYGNGKSIKFIKVDGVEPNKQTMASGEYPLLGNNYAVFRADIDEDAPVRRLVDWMTSYDGQLAIAQAGYITMDDIGFDYTEMTLKRWEGIGTGIQKPKNFKIPTYQYIAGDGTLPLYLNMPSQGKGLAKGTTYSLTCLTDKMLQAEVNAWIADAMARSDGKAEQLLNKLNEVRFLSFSDIKSKYSYYDPNKPYPSASAIATAKNGYLSVTVAMVYMLGIQDGYQRIYHVEAGVWDLYTGKKLTPEDLFYNGVDVDAVLNRYLKKLSDEPPDPFGIRYEMKRDFAGLTTNGWAMTADTIYITHDNPYFGFGFAADLALEEGVLACEQPRDMSGCFEGIRVEPQFRVTTKNNVYKRVCNDFVSTAFLEESSYPTAAKINAAQMALYEENYSDARIREFFKEQGLDYDGEWYWSPTWRINEYIGKFVQFGMWWDEIYYKSQSYVYPYMPMSVFYDLTTGKELDWRTLLKDGWREHSGLGDWYNKGYEIATFDFSGMYLYDIYDEGSSMLLQFRTYDVNETLWFNLTVPKKYINW